MASSVLPAGPLRVLELHQGGGTQRARAEAFLEAEYARAFGGRLRSHYPILLSVNGAEDQVLAVAGFRLASSGPLFLEQYLDEPAEVVIARRLGEPVARDAVIEIGNLAGTSPCVSRVLFSALAARLRTLGATHAVATATRQLRRSFERVGFPVAYLADAEPDRLALAAADWGSYYARDPQVVAGQIDAALPALRAGAVRADTLASRLAQRAGCLRQAQAAAL